jgi:signal transduction histidine kinase
LPAHRDAVKRLWTAGLALGSAIDRLMEEHGEKPDHRGLEWSLLLQGPLWVMAGIAPGELAEWLATDDSASRKSIESGVLGVSADVWSQWFLNRSRRDELAHALWLIKAAPNFGARENDLRFPGSRIAELVHAAYGVYASTKYALKGLDDSDKLSDDPRVALTEAKVRTILARQRLDPPDDPALVRRSLALIRSTHRSAASEKRAALVESLVARINSDIDGFLGTDEPQMTSVLSAASETAVSRVDVKWRRFHEVVWSRLTQIEDWTAELGRKRIQAESQAQASRFESLAEFAAGAGHELNNPLAVIQGRAQLLLAKATDDQSRSSLKAIIDQTLRAHRMLRDLIFVARPSEPRPRGFRPADSLRAVVREFKAEALRRDQRMHVQICPDSASLELDRYDPDTFRHVCSSLLRNALEAGPEGSRVDLSLKLDTQGLVLQVEDNGRGFDTKESRHLFDPFYCGRRAGRGLGLGLPRVARSVAQMNGRVRYRSQPGQGTVFEVILPMPRSETIALSQSA